MLDAALHQTVSRRLCHIQPTSSVSAACSSPALPAQEAQGDQTTALHRLRTLSVVVDAVPPALLTLGVSTEILRLEVEKQLRAASIELNERPDAMLYVTLNAVSIESQSRRPAGVAYTIYLRVEQDAQLNTSQAPIPVSTWRHGGMGVTNIAQGSRAVRQQLAEYVGTFMKAYRASNE